MAETPPSSTEKTVVANNCPICRLGTLTIASLAFNALILVLLVVGAIIHHHCKHHGFGGGGRFEGQCQMGSSSHHFGGMGMNRGWGRPDGFRGGRDGGGKEFGHRDGGEDRFGGREGGPGGAPSGMPGMRGMMNGAMGKPDPAKMTDMILNHLSEKLTLTDDQKAKIKPIIEQQVAEIQKQMEAQRAAMKKQIEDGKAKIKPLLTADQQKQLDAMPLPGQKPAASEEAKQPAPAPKPGQ
jgi:hypothetical protein